MSTRLIFGDCLEKMSRLKANSVDLVLTDPPYGTTTCKWDSIIPLAPMWAQLARIAKPNSAIVMTASQPFTTTLIASNMKRFKYCWVWHKKRISNPQLAKYQPLKCHEDIVVFSSGTGKAPYNPQGLVDCEKVRKKDSSNLSNCVGRKAYTQTKTNYPKSIQTFPSETGLHPTQKPVTLMEYLISTYTDVGDTVLDFTMGSGTTGVACKNLSRNFIGIEKDKKYFDIAERRCKKVRK